MPAFGGHEERDVASAKASQDAFEASPDADASSPDATDASPDAAPGTTEASAGISTASPGLAARIAAEFSPRSLWQNHRLFTFAALAALAPRVLALLAFRPALLTSDSFIYMHDALAHKLGAIRPSGYSFFLWFFHFFPQALLLVTIVQHLAGIAVAVVVYALLRHWGLPGWGATLAATPVLFDTRQVALESYVLPDTVFCLTVLIVVALLITRATPGPWRCAVAGLAMAYVTVLRGNGLPLAFVVGAFLLIRNVGWRAVMATAAAFCVPVLGYVLAYHAASGEYNITSSDGLFLWSRTTSFANCAIIKPPPGLVPLCPTSQTKIKRPARTPAWSISALLKGPTPADYLWAPNAWWHNDAHPGVNAYNSAVGMQFALDAIKAQPLDYLRVSARDVLATFLTTDRPVSHAAMTFTTRPHIARLPAKYRRDIMAFAGTTSNTHPVYPYAYFLFLYQQPVYFPGVIFLLVVIAGMISVLRNWRRWGGMQALPWALAAVSIVTPALLTQGLYRYAMVAIPLSCLALGLSFARQASQTTPSLG